MMLRLVDSSDGVALFSRSANDALMALLVAYNTSNSALLLHGLRPASTHHSSQELPLSPYTVLSFSLQGLGRGQEEGPRNLRGRG